MRTAKKMFPYHEITKSHDSNHLLLFLFPDFISPSSMDLDLDLEQLYPLIVFAIVVFGCFTWLVYTIAYFYCCRGRRGRRDPEPLTYDRLRRHYDVKLRPYRTETGRELGRQLLRSEDSGDFHLDSGTISTIFNPHDSIFNLNGMDITSNYNSRDCLSHDYREKITTFPYGHKTPFTTLAFLHNPTYLPIRQNDRVSNFAINVN